MGEKLWKKLWKKYLMLFRADGGWELGWHEVKGTKAKKRERKWKKKANQKEKDRENGKRSQTKWKKCTQSTNTRNKTTKTPPSKDRISQ